MNGAKLSALVKASLESTYNAKVVNVISAGESGVADLLACIEGKFCALEIKGDGDVVHAIQAEFLRQVSAAGGCSGVVHSIDDAHNIIVNNLQYIDDNNVVFAL